MKNNTSRKNGTLMQLANAYALLMIIGSYFRTCTCKSLITEDMLYLHYRSLDPGRQINTEEKIINYIENRFGDKLKTLSDLSCEAHIYQYGDTWQIVFETGFEGMVAIIDNTGRYSIHYCSHTVLGDAG